MLEKSIISDQISSVVSLRVIGNCGRLVFYTTQCILLNMFLALIEDEGGSKRSLSAILQHSVMNTVNDLKEEFKAIKGTSGTRIVVSHLRKHSSGNKHEFDFTTDSNDIRIPDDLIDSDELKYRREQRQDHIPASDYSLRVSSNFLVKTAPDYLLGVNTNFLVKTYSDYLLLLRGNINFLVKTDSWTICLGEISNSWSRHTLTICLGERATSWSRQTLTICLGERATSWSIQNLTICLGK